MLWTLLFGVVTLVLLARALGFGTNARLTSAEDAAVRAAEALAGFTPAEAAVSADGCAALVAGQDGRLALVNSFGDRFVVRPLDGTRAALEGDTLRLRLDEPGTPTVRLDLGDATCLWAARFNRP
jgi:hypothetical protein